MLHIVLIDECFPLNTRNRKILDSFAESFKDKAELHVITWDRNNEYTQEMPGYHVYKKVSAYGNRVRKFLNMWGYYKYCRTLIKQMKPDVVIASHWNNLLMVPKLNRNRQILIYENLDMPSGPSFVRKITTTLEKRKMRQVDLTVHASRFFATQYPASFKQIVLENKPTFKVTASCGHELHAPIRLAFIGNLRYSDILKNLIEAVRDDKRFELYFHGNGPSEVPLKQAAGDASNVFFTGYYAYNDVPRLYEQTDVVWAAYPNKDFNVKYAISNKFHESVLFGIPAIYSWQTCLGDYAVEHRIGLEVNPYSVEDIKAVLDRIATGNVDMESMKAAIIGFRSQQTSWDDDFKTFIGVINQLFHNK